MVVALQEDSKFGVKESIPKFNVYHDDYNGVRKTKLNCTTLNQKMNDTEGMN